MINVPDPFTLSVVYMTTHAMFSTPVTFQVSNARPVHARELFALVDMEKADGRG